VHTRARPQPGAGHTQVCRKLGIAKWPYRRRKGATESRQATYTASRPEAGHARDTSHESLTKNVNEDSKAKADAGDTSLGAEIPCGLGELGSLPVADSMCGVRKRTSPGPERTGDIADRRGWRENSIGMTSLLREVAVHEVWRMGAGEAGGSDASAVRSSLGSLLQLCGEGNARAPDHGGTLAANKMHDGRGIITDSHGNPNGISTTDKLEDTLEDKLDSWRSVLAEGRMKPTSEEEHLPKSASRVMCNMMSPRARLSCPTPPLPHALAAVVVPTAPLSAMSTREVRDVQRLAFENNREILGEGQTRHNHNTCAAIHAATVSSFAKHTAAMYRTGTLAQPREWPVTCQTWPAQASCLHTTHQRHGVQLHAADFDRTGSGVMLPPLNQLLLSCLP